MWAILLLFFCASPQGANKARLDFAKKHLKKPDHFWKSILWMVEIKINLYQNEGKEKVWRRLGTAHDNIISETWWSSVMAWAWLPVALGYCCLVMMRQKQPDIGYTLCPDSAKWSKVDWAALHRTNGRWPKTYSKCNPGVFEGKKVEYSAMAESISWSQPDWAAFHSLKTKLKAERPTNKQQLKSAAVKTWQSITKEETQSLLMSTRSRLKAAIACKGFSTKY